MATKKTTRTKKKSGNVQSTAPVADTTSPVTPSDPSASPPDTEGTSTPETTEASSPVLDENVRTISNSILVETGVTLESLYKVHSQIEVDQANYLALTYMLAHAARRIGRETSAVAADVLEMIQSTNEDEGSAKKTA